MGAVALASCSKDAIQDITIPNPPSAAVRFFNFGMNTPTGGVNFYANTTKMTATSSTTGAEANTGVAFGGVGAGGLYSAIEPGTYDIKATIAAATDKDLAINTLNTTIAAGKYYSYYTSGLYNTTTKTVDGFIVEDPIPEFDYSVAKVRFVNAIYNSTPMTLIARNTVAPNPETTIGGAVAYKAAGEFVSVAPGSYDLRTTGTGTNLPTRAAVTFTAGRVYTITARGDITVVSTTLANRPFLDNTLNR
jgi:hypothetical protein